MDLISKLMKEAEELSTIKDKLEAKLKNKSVNEKLRGSQDKSVLEELFSKGKI